jgi:hypothetical protein
MHTMPMVPFYTQFPEIAARETRSIIVWGQDDLPDGEYGFLEFYCNEKNCDCRRVIFSVTEAEQPNKILATINYGWESARFYANRNEPCPCGSQKKYKHCCGAIGVFEEFSL